MKEFPYNQGMQREETRRLFAWRGWSGLVCLSVGLLVLSWLLNTPPGWLGKADAVGYAVCHRIETRSFHLGERPLPLCARCSGMYLGAVLGLVFQGVLGAAAGSGSRRSGGPARWTWAPLSFFVLAFVVDGGNSFLGLIPFAPHLYETQNWTRLLTGTGMGLAIALFLFPAFNQTVWVKPDPRPALPGWGSLGLLALLALVLDGLVLWEQPQVLYPLALISAAGVLLILTLAYSMLWLLVLKRENQAHNFVELLLPLGAGFGSAVLQIALLDLGRYLLTGTWQGFSLG